MSHGEDEDQYSPEIQKLLAHGEKLVSTCHYEQGLKFYLRALEQLPDDADILEDVGTIYLELGDPEAAREHLLRSVENAPDSCTVALLNLAQLSEGDEALQFYSNAEQLLRGVVEQEEENEEAKHELSSVLCAMAEVYLTDCCFADDAETRCETLLNEALELHPTNAEALMQKASMHISQQRPLEAHEVLNRSYAIWQNAPLEEKPPLQMRLSCAKMFIELDFHQVALPILEEAVQENDEIAETWYLLCVVHMLTDTIAAEECIDNCIELMLRDGETGDALTEMESIQKQLREHNSELMDDAQDGDDAEVDSENDDGDDDGGGSESMDE